MRCRSQAKDNSGARSGLPFSSRVATVVRSRNPEVVTKIVFHVDSGWAGRKTSHKSNSGKMLIVEDAREVVDGTGRGNVGRT